MNHIKFSIRILKTLRQQLETEAEDQGRSINRQLELILKERYGAHSPPSTAKSRASNGSASSRVKTKATA